MPRRRRSVLSPRSTAASRSTRWWRAPTTPTYGLNASVWTRDARAGRAVAERLQAGTVNINEAYAASWASASPMGGFKESGMGRRHGATGILKYTEAQTVATQRLLAIDTPPFLSHEQYADRDESGAAPAQAHAPDRLRRVRRVAAGDGAAPEADEDEGGPRPVPVTDAAEDVPPPRRR